MKNNSNIFKRPQYLTKVKIEINDVQCICPISKKIDKYVIKIFYIPNETCLSVDSIENYLKEYKNRIVFSENFVNDIALFIKNTINSKKVKIKAIKIIENNKIITEAIL